MNLCPEEDIEINSALFRTLSLFFPDSTKNINIHSGWKVYKPEFGFTRSRCAVEYKFVKNPQQLGFFVDQILAELTGYNGSKDWTRFLSVFYCKESFITEKTLKDEFSNRIEACKGKWEFILPISRNIKISRREDRCALTGT